MHVRRQYYRVVESISYSLCKYPFHVLSLTSLHDVVTAHRQQVPKLENDRARVKSRQERVGVVESSPDLSWYKLIGLLGFGLEKQNLLQRDYDVIDSGTCAVLKVGEAVRDSPLRLA